MLIKYPNELRAIYPSSRFQSIEPLLSMFQQVERGVLYRILGTELYKKLNEDYEQLCYESDGIWADRVEEPDERVFILRACQSVIVYRALSDNVGILSSSLNQGGGFNQASAQNYDTLDKENRSDLKKDLFHNSARAVENLLVLLEEDARSSEPLYADLWKKSSYYYYQSQLLIPSATMMHPYFLDLGPEPHSKFVSIISNMFDAQTLKIESRIGFTLMKELLEADKPSRSDDSSDSSSDGPSDVDDNTDNDDTEDTGTNDSPADAVGSSDVIVLSLDDEESVPEDTPSGADEDSNESIDDSDDTATNASDEDVISNFSPDPVKRKNVVLQALPVFRHALASYVRADIEDDRFKQDTYNNRGDRYMNNAVSFFVSHPELFHEELASDLDADYRAKHNGRGIDDEEKKPTHHRPGNLFDFGGLCHK